MSKYDYELDFLSESDDRSVISYSYNRNKVNDAMVDMHKDDKYCFVRKYRGPDGKLKKNLIFGCGDVGTTIRNAVTGEKYYGHKVGSKSEDIYFKARLCTGEFGNDIPMLFYDSAEQYEKHLGGTIDQSIKNSASLRQRLARVVAESEKKPRVNFVVR
jgi:hypothetical protein